MDNMTILAGIAIGLVLHDPLAELVARVVHLTKYLWGRVHGKQEAYTG